MPPVTPARPRTTTCDDAGVKYLTHTLVVLIVAIQYPLWIGKGSWLRVWDLGRQVEQQKEKNQQLVTRNAGLDAEVRDLKQGSDAVEERARVELGMIKSDEVFYQIVDPQSSALPASAAPATTAVPASTPPASTVPPAK